VNLRRFFADLISRVCFPAVSKTSGDFADPPDVCCGSLNALD
jgi:hypothetical protein